VGSHQRKPPHTGRLGHDGRPHELRARRQAEPRRTRRIVKYLSDAYGLSPDESAAHRYIVDRTPSVVEHPENKLIGDTCARCHSYGRIAVQRRTEADWRKLVHFHVGQFPAIEIQAGGRDRNWFEIATGDASVELGKVYGFESDSWNKWKAQKPADASGSWRLVGHKPGTGAYEGMATVKRTGNDAYSVSMTVRYENGTSEQLSGSALVYTGHEWRATLKSGEREINQVMTLADGGRRCPGAGSSPATTRSAARCVPCERTVQRRPCCRYSRPR
jgi:quinohemoprotein amine dehydrogenase